MASLVAYHPRYSRHGSFVRRLTLWGRDLQGFVAAGWYDGEILMRRAANVSISMMGERVKLPQYGSFAPVRRGTCRTSIGVGSCTRPPFAKSLCGWRKREQVLTRPIPQLCADAASAF